jgi:hypothetical protein
MASHLESITGARRSLARVSNIVGSVTPGDSAKSLKDYLSRFNVETPHDVKDGLGTILGAAAGGLAWRDHRVLGVLTGASLGRNVPALLNAQDRPHAVRNMGVTGAAVMGSLLLRDHPKVGFLVGWLLGGLVLGESR